MADDTTRTAYQDLFLQRNMRYCPAERQAAAEAKGQRVWLEMLLFHLNQMFTTGKPRVSSWSI
jgi:hypothetical protein